MYHCYFLINYIGPPKVFFLSFGPLFKKFAHHWSKLKYCPENIHGMAYSSFILKAVGVRDN